MWFSSRNPSPIWPLTSAFRHGLAMADAIVYATAKDQEADVVTGEADLKDLPGVVYIK
jgi:hypothetical protein